MYDIQKEKQQQQNVEWNVIFLGQITRSILKWRGDKLKEKKTQRRRRNSTPKSINKLLWIYWAYLKWTAHNEIQEIHLFHSLHHNNFFLFCSCIFFFFFLFFVLNVNILQITQFLITIFVLVNERVTNSFGRIISENERPKK